MGSQAEHAGHLSKGNTEASSQQGLRAHNSEDFHPKILL